MDSELAQEGANLYRRLVGDTPLTLELEGVELEDFYNELLTSTLSSENKPMRENNCKIPSDEEMEKLVRKLTNK